MKYPVLNPAKITKGTFIDEYPYGSPMPTAKKKEKANGWFSKKLAKEEKNKMSEKEIKVEADKAVFNVADRVVFNVGNDISINAGHINLNGNVSFMGEDYEKFADRLNTRTKRALRFAYISIVSSIALTMALGFIAFFILT